jgi:hypothetical protein
MNVIRIVVMSHTSELSGFLDWLSTQPPLRVRNIGRVYDVYPPESESDKDSWVRKNTDRLQDMHINAVKAPAWVDPNHCQLVRITQDREAV